MNHNFTRLRAFILKHSLSQDWTTARLEWTLNDVEDLEEACDQCPCGYEPIRYLCWLLNTKNNALIYVGNVCVNRFMPEHDSVTLFDGLKRIQSDNTKAPSPTLLVWARKGGIITGWEYQFGMNTCRKRILSERQMLKRQQINRQIEAKLAARRKAGHPEWVNTSTPVEYKNGR